jgi:hypothetical protein
MNEQVASRSQDWGTSPNDILLKLDWDSTHGDSYEFDASELAVMRSMVHALQGVLEALPEVGEAA